MAYTYIGPYVECKFISNESYETEVIQKDLLSNVLSVFVDETLHSHCWIPNRKVPGISREFIIENLPLKVIYDFMANLWIENACFSGFFEKELVLLRNEYGEQNVRIKWGLIRNV